MSGLEGMRPDTLAVRGGLARSSFDETAEALFLTSGFVYDSAEQAEAAFKDEVDQFIYSRYGNPTVAMFEERLRLLEGAEACFATASGMSAVFVALAALLGRATGWSPPAACSGRASSSSTRSCPAGASRRCSSTAPTSSSGARPCPSRPRPCSSRRRATRCRSWSTCAPSSDLAHAAGAQVVVDNVFGTPVFSKPLEHGADIVVYSATKHIDGQGRTLGGAVLGTAGVHRRPGQEPHAAHRARRCRRSTPGSSSRAWRPCPCGSRSRPPPRWRWRAVARGAPQGDAGGLPVAGVAPAARAGPPADVRRGHRRDLRGRRRQGRGVRRDERPAGHRHQQQPRRRQVDGHPPGHHDAPSARARRRGPRSGITGRHGAHLGRPGGRPRTSSRTSTRALA